MTSISGSPISASYESSTRGMFHSAAYASPRSRVRLATVVTSLRAEARIAGMIRRLIRAVERSPQRRRAMRGLLDPHDAVGDPLEAFEHRRIVPRNDQVRTRGERLGAVLRLEVARLSLLAIHRLCDRRVLLEILVEVDVVRGEHGGAASDRHRAELRFVRVLAADVTADAGNDFLVVSLDEAQPSLG